MKKETQGNTPPRKKRKKWLVIIIVIIVILIIIGAAAGSDPESTTNAPNGQTTVEQKDDSPEANDADSTTLPSDNSKNSSTPSIDNKPEPSDNDSQESEGKPSGKEIDSRSQSIINDYYPMSDSYERAISDLYGRYEDGSESAVTSAKRLSGFANGIQNTIDAITAEDAFTGQDQMIGLFTAYKVVAKRYSEYISTGNQSALDDANGMIDRAEELKSEIDDFIK